MQAQRAIVGLHFLQFRHWTVRWLYFAAGLAGCVMIGAGLVVWLEARRERHARLGLPGVGLVEALSIAAVPGLVIASLVFLLVNRLLPSEWSVAGWDRAALEKAGFFLAWLATLLHAAVHGRLQQGLRSPAWRAQCTAIAGLAAGVVLAHWIGTGQHLLRSIQQAQWSVAGVDLVLLGCAALAFWVRRRLDPGRAAAQPSSQPLTQPSHG
jgi:hypothetical protein